MIGMPQQGAVVPKCRSWSPAGEAGRPNLEWKFRRRAGAIRQGASDVAVALFDGDQWDAAAWPSTAADPALEMSVFQTREFLETWMGSIGRSRGVRPFLAVAADRGGRPLLYLPLAVETRFGVTLLRFMDAGVSDLNAPVVTRERQLTAEEFAMVWQEVIAQLPPIDAIDLHKMPDDLNGVRNPLTYLAGDSRNGHGYLLVLSNLAEVHERGSVLRLHKKLRRQLRQLSRRGEIHFASNPPGEALHRVVDGLFSLKRMQYLRTWGRDFLAMPGIEKFYRDMAGPGRLGLISDLSALTVGDDLVSAHLGFAWRKRFYYVMPAYNTRYRTQSPGSQLLDHLMRRFRDDGYDLFDLGEGAHAYKGLWATHRIPLRSYQRALTLAGTLFLQANRIRRQLHIEIPRFPAGTRSVDRH
jgi:CelD/BcsL family acetyltransferase involved in cellulose biosynthesis